MDHASTVSDEVRALGRELRRAIPEVYRGYAQLRKAALAPGELDVRTKELIALAIAVTRECDGCIASHAQGAPHAGATEAQVAEALGVAVLMNGGPGTVYAPRAFAAFREFVAAPRSPAEPHTRQGNFTADSNTSCPTPP